LTRAWSTASTAQFTRPRISKFQTAGGPAKGSDFTWHVKGNLFLTGNQWSSERFNDDRGHPSAYEWYFDFNEGKSNNEPSGFPYSSSSMRGLCVRSSGK
jgi:hypothetical protein